MGNPDPRISPQLVGAVQAQSAPNGIEGAKRSAGFCCQVPADPACYPAKSKGLVFEDSNRLRGQSDLSIVVIRNYKFSPITAVPCRAKTHPLRPRRSCFAPIGSPHAGEEMVEAPGTAPGSDGFITIAIYRHSRCRQALYRPSRWGLQMRRTAPAEDRSATQIS
jgi:hypothetical protein